MCKFRYRDADSCLTMKNSTFFEIMNLPLLGVNSPQLEISWIGMNGSNHNGLVIWGPIVLLRFNLFTVLTSLNTVKCLMIRSEIPLSHFMLPDLYATNSMTPPASVILRSASLLTYLERTTMGKAGKRPLPSSLE
jgi:hypothetical protein